MIHSIVVHFLMDIPCHNIESVLDDLSDAKFKRDDPKDYGYLDLNKHMIKFVEDTFPFTKYTSTDSYYDVTISTTIKATDLDKLDSMNTIILNEFNAELERMGAFKTKSYKKWLKISKGLVRNTD